jgi:hypothetical protein
VNIQLERYVMPVDMDGIPADFKFICDLFVAQTFRHQLDNFSFP